MKIYPEAVDLIFYLVILLIMLFLINRTMIVFTHDTSNTMDEVDKKHSVLATDHEELTQILRMLPDGLILVKLERKNP